MPPDYQPSVKRAMLFAGILTVLQSLPWFPLMLAKISPVAFAAESVAYRYFHSFRIVRSDPSTIWEAQGQSLGVLHEFFQLLLDWFGVAALRSRMDLFSYGTLALNSLAFGLGMWAIDRALPAGWRPRLLLVAVALWGVYGSRWGLFSARLPDYYTYEVTLTVACLALFMLRVHQREARMSNARAVALGALAGVMAGIKFTLLPTALLPLLPYLMGSTSSWQQLARWAALWVLGLAAASGTVISVYYQFDFRHLAEAFAAWRSFVSAPGAEPGFIASILHPFAPGKNPWADHRFVPVVVVLWLSAVTVHAVAGYREPDRRAHVLLGLFSLGASGLHVWAVFKRPAETTLFETTLFLAAVAAALLVSLTTRPLVRKATNLWLVLAFGWCLVSSLLHFPRLGTIASLQATSRNAWELHDWLNAIERPVVVLLPDNRFVSGTVEETLLKGFSDVPSWNITTGYALLDQVAPRRLFVTQISDAPAGAVLVWTDVPDINPMADLTQTSAVVLGRVPEKVRTWRMQRNEFWPRVVHAAVFAPADAGVNESVLKSTSTWRDSSPADPLAGFSLSPADAAPRVELRSADGRPVVRITATKATPYLALGGSIPALPDGTGPWLVRATVRVGAARPILWQIYVVVDGQGTVESIIESIAARPTGWTSWSIRKPATRYASSMDNFSVGIAKVQPGDWFEVAELTLLNSGAPKVP